jgi:putative transposase
MARKPRIDAEGCLHHVMARGNGGQRIFLDERDRPDFLGLVADGVKRFGHSVHAFCLMDNHVHLAIRTGPVPLSRIMQNLMFRYTRLFNERQSKSGHLFQGRFRSIVVDEESYLLEIVRYIHLNPARAKLVRDPSEWPWSGHRAYLGKAETEFLETSWVLRRFGPAKAEARRRYEAFVLQGLSEAPKPELVQGLAEPRVLGDETFAEGLLMARGGRVAPPPSADELVAAVCGEWGLCEADLGSRGRGRHAAEARAVLGLLAQDLRGTTMTQLAARFGRDMTTLSASVVRLRARAREDAALARRIEMLLRRFAGRVEAVEVNGESPASKATTQA